MHVLWTKDVETACFAFLFKGGLADPRMRASNEGLLRPRVALVQKIIRLHPTLLEENSKGFGVGYIGKERSVFFKILRAEQGRQQKAKTLSQDAQNGRPARPQRGKTRRRTPGGTLRV